MILAIDSGNTHITFGLYRKEALAGTWRCRNDSERTADEYAVWLFQLLELSGVRASDIRHSVLASVVPQTAFHLRKLCENHFEGPLIVADRDTVPVEILLDQPDELGADRLINAFAAFSLYQRPAIIVDFGTATTFDNIDAQGRYSGGLIAPGIASSLEALYDKTAQLPLVALERPSSIIGRNTVSAIKSGVFWGSVSMIEGLVARMCEERGGDKPLVIATGGLAPLLGKDCRVIDEVRPDLTLEGLFRLVTKKERN